VPADPHSDLLPDARLHEVRKSRASQIVEQKPGLADRLNCLPPRIPEVSDRLAVSMKHSLTGAGTRRPTDEAGLPTLL
jgi:hypothetical protein